MNLDFKTRNQLLRFIPVGIINTTVDWSILNLLLFFSKTKELFLYSVFKTISFFVAVIVSYFLNQYFVFSDRNSAGLTKPEKQRRLGSFFCISLLAAWLNIISASLITNSCYQHSLPGTRVFLFCSNLGAVVGTIIAAAGNFIGYKKLVFKD